MQRSLCAMPKLFPSIAALVVALFLSAGPAAAAADDLPVGHYLLPEEGDIIGRVQVVRAEQEDTVLEIGRRHGVGFEEMRLANPDISLWVPGEGTEVVVPTRFILPPGPREGVVVNVAEMRLYYYPPQEGDEPRRVETYPVSVGRMDWDTPVGETEITAKAEDPAWYPPESIREFSRQQGTELPRVVPPGPDNPLGRHAMRLGIPGYLIHGTNRPWGIGMRVTAGCIRMYPEDIEDLFPRLPVGTSVKLVNAPFKAGWKDDTLYLQAYPLLEEERENTPMSEQLGMAADAVAEALGDRRHRVDYNRLRRLVESPTGLPVPISRDADVLLPGHLSGDL
ncbi:L,D-transpeptidase ErfK/SrfK [Alkalispirillum mobile]|uniref:L,D-transpeptidase ErfK/SrfK n=1 Tax=Alkalispirillum mobile TaxID=85925 RepID=A0A498CE02_9GAMM|nr:L,D-transpeptidase family protein [Alkalispirillum mobile]RLK50521.1 L,D-transpeptidase ErfK/SrfK [Alkalispirillum mobile]